MNLRGAGECVVWWSDTLNLGSWRISCEEKGCLSKDSSLLEICPTRSRHQATIYLKTGVLGSLEDSAIERLLVHELVHLLYDPLVEEHDLQLEFLMVHNRRQESKVRFIQTLEKAVEHTAQLLCSSIPLCSAQPAFYAEEEFEAVAKLSPAGL